MPELDERLRADAERPLRLPDFEAALHIAMDAPVLDVPDRRPGTRWRIAAAAAAVVAVAGGVTAVALASQGDNDGAPAVKRTMAPAPHRTKAKPFSQPAGTVVGMANSPTATAGGNKQIMVFIKPQTPRGCLPGDVSPTVSETSTQIRIRTTTELTAEQAKSYNPVPACGNVMTEVVTGIKKPLGHRTVIDVNSGHTVPVYVPNIPVPTYLPHGYPAIDTRYTDPMSTYEGDTLPGFLAPISFAFVSGPGLATNSPEPILSVTQSPFTRVNPGATTIDQVAITGHPALVTRIPSAVCVTWTRGTGDSIQVCSVARADNSGRESATQVEQQQKQEEKHLLSENELLEVARGLTYPG